MELAAVYSVDGPSLWFPLSQLLTSVRRRCFAALVLYLLDPLTSLTSVNKNATGLFSIWVCCSGGKMPGVRGLWLEGDLVEPCTCSVSSARTRMLKKCQEPRVLTTPDDYLKSAEDKLCFPKRPALYFDRGQPRVAASRGRANMRAMECVRQTRRLFSGCICSA